MINFTYLSEHFGDISQSIRDVYVRRECPGYGYAAQQVIDAAIPRFTGSRAQKRRIINLINYRNYTHTFDSDNFPGFNPELVDTFDIDADDFEMKRKLGLAYIELDDINWDIDTVDTDALERFRKDEEEKKARNAERDKVISKSIEENPIEINHAELLGDVSEKEMAEDEEPPIEYKTTRKNISFQFPKYPRFDPKKLWGLCEDDGGRVMPVYYTLPEIPTVQNEITITTDFTKMTDREFMNLYPDHTIRTRRDEMYVPRRGFEYDELVGFIPKISGFTTEQVLDNIFQYPQFNFMFRMVNGKRVSFLKHIEVDGELLTLKEAVNEVEDMANLPDSEVFYWDYIVRRYLLERDNCTVEHKYPLEGFFNPFITLFTTPETYKSRGYVDTLGMAKKCVRGRVLFYQSRNPLTRRMFE